MKIFICGVPRAGKSTLAKFLKTQIENSNLIVTEAIRNGFQAIDEEHAYDWGRRQSDLRQKVFPKYVKAFLDWNEKFSETITILDCALIELDKVLQIKDKDDIVICIGFGGKGLQEIFKIIRKFEKQDDYTTQFSNQKLQAIWGDISQIDNNNIEFCAKNKIKYFDTSNRSVVQHKILNYIQKQIDKINHVDSRKIKRE